MERLAAALLLLAATLPAVSPFRGDVARLLDDAQAATTRRLTDASGQLLPRIHIYEFPASMQQLFEPRAVSCCVSPVRAAVETQN